ncbi:hypothetical protein [Streptomyces sp. H27-D2]|uniref:hypothetical protein n=1 Tax=Streptomyces sp. H27-D2 TaxID=3046304 RepID=UPI002DB89731|nr:hypothetical protein [Streptomyces sp. H27-D2]MEC4019412.1 hypothetical protein [Streptomyces sp. H27-D2]
MPPVITRLDGMWTWDSWPEIEAQVRDLRNANELVRAQQTAAKKNQAEAHATAWASRRGAAAV